MGEKELHGGGDDGQSGEGFDSVGSSLVTVTSGAYSEQVNATGKSVAEIRALFGQRFDIDPHSLAYINGKQVSESHTCKPGEVLMFSRRSGEKG